MYLMKNEKLANTLSSPYIQIREVFFQPGNIKDDLESVALRFFTSQTTADP